MSLRLGIGLGIIPSAARPVPTTEPVNVVAPSITGILTEGQTGTVDPGAWTGLPGPSYTYQWQRSGVNIGGATASTRVFNATDVAAGASAITVEVTATNDVGPTTAESAGVTIAAPLSISGTPPEAVVGEVYSFVPTITGGHTPYSVALTGSLPAGLSFNTSTGAITGTPLSSGTAEDLNMTVTDGNALTDPLGVFDLVVSTGEPTPYEGLVATRCRGVSTANLANKQIMTRSPHVATDDISSLKIAISNFRLTESTSSSELGLGGSITVTASVEYPAGTFKRITFDVGSTSAVVADGGIKFSDYTTGDLAIPGGATFWIRIYRTSATGILYSGYRNSAMGELTTVAVSGLADATMGGTITSSGNFSAPPFMIIGQTIVPSVCLIGDSITHGYLDAAESATAAGPGLRGSIAKSFPADLPFLNISTGGWRANLWATESASRSQVLPYFSHYVLSLGRNDIVVSSASAATLKTNLEIITAAILSANPDAEISLVTLTPTSTSASGNWTSLADQTASPSNSVRVTHNTAVRAGTITGNNNGYFEIADPVETSRDAGKWKFDGTNDKYTNDGVHPVTAGYDLIVTAGAVDLTKFEPA